MNRLKYLVVACLFLTNSPPVVAQQSFDVYIGAGQSNLDGRAEVSDLTGELASFATPQSGTLIYYNNPPEPDPNDTLDQAITTNGFVTLQPGYGFLGARDFGDVVTLPSDLFGPEVAFGSAISSEVGSVNPVAIIKVARGGTNLDNDWRAADANIPGDQGGPLYAELLATIDAATAELTSNGDTFTIRGFIWHQGEADDSNARASRYMDNFRNFVDGVRAHVGIPDLPFVIGELAQSRTSSNNDSFRALQAQVASSLNRVGFVSSVGLTTPLSTGEGSDGTHFDAAGQIGLGLRFAEELADLINDDGVSQPTSESVTFDLDNTPTTGLVPLGFELDSLDEPENLVDSPSTAILEGITFVATAETTIVDQTPDDPQNPSGATFNAGPNGAGVNSLGGTADGDVPSFVDPGETLTLTLNFDASTTTVALTQIIFNSLGDVTDSATISIADGAGISLHDDVAGGQVANTTFTFAGDAFSTSAPLPLSSGDTIVFTNVSTGNYRITGLTLQIGTPDVPGLTGDFDDDGDVDVDDINHYVGNLNTNAAGETAELDLNGDGEITFTDVQLHIETYVQTDNGQTGTFLGDLDLDGSVDVVGDAFLLISSLGTSVTSYGDGDINLDGVVDVVGDAFLLISNLGLNNEL